MRHEGVLNQGRLLKKYFLTLGWALIRRGRLIESLRYSNCRLSVLSGKSEQLIQKKRGYPMLSFFPQSQPAMEGQQGMFLVDDTKC